MPDLDPTLLKSLGAYLQVQSLVIAVVLGALAGCGLRALLLLALDRGAGRLVIVGRLWVAICYGLLTLGYAALVAPMVHWSTQTALVAAGTVLAMLAGVVALRYLLGYVPRLSFTGILLRALFLMTVLLLALLALMRAGFLNLTTDRPVLRIELTGETRPQTVRWAAPDQPMQEQALRTHRILLKTPDGELVSEEWLYGDQVALKGRVLRLNPLLNTVGIGNLYDLQFVHNGYFTVERHSSMPHLARALRRLGSLAVAPAWQPAHDRVLQWLQKRPAESQLAVHAVTSESTYFPLVDAQGQPIHHTFDLVVTPGGLTAR